MNQFACRDDWAIVAFERIMYCEVYRQVDKIDQIHQKLYQCTRIRGIRSFLEMVWIGCSLGLHSVFVRHSDAGFIQ